MIDVKVLAVDKKGSGGTSGGHTNTTAYVPKDIVVSSIRLGDIFLSYDKDNNAIKVAKTDGGAANFYALGGISALGVSGVQDGGGGTSYNRLDSWASYDSSKAGWVLSAGLGNDLNSRVTSLENGQIEGVATQEWVQQQGYLTELSAATINALGAIKIGYSANGKNYPVLLDKNNRAYVSVPWNDTTYGVFGASANGLVPMASASNKTTAETAVGNYYLCADGKFRQLPANAFNDTWRPLGSGATDACAGNDARLSDARPASDVYAWAKASTKPTYTLDEVADGSSRKLSNYLPLSGGTMTGAIKWNANIGTEENSWNNTGTYKGLEILNCAGYQNTGAPSNYAVGLKVSSYYSFMLAYNASVERLYYKGGSMIGWDKLANFSDLASYLPLAGGTMSNTNVVTNLNADLLDGQHGAYYAKAADVTTLQGYFTNGVANKSIYNDNYGNVSSNLTVAEAKAQLATLVGGQRSGVGYNINISASYISQWDNDEATFYATSGYSVIKIGGAYSGANYGQWLLSSFGLEKIGVVGRNNGQWTNIKWLPFSDGTGASGTWGINITGNAASATSVPWSGITSKPTTLSGYGITDGLKSYQDSAVQTDLTWIKTLADNIRRGFVYNNNGVEWSYLLGLKSTGGALRYGAILKMGYQDKYLRMLRIENGTWKSDDWEKISAGYSDTAGTATTLATPRTIWGQSFNGSANVSGAMTGVTSMDSLLYFDTTNGYIGIGTSSSRRELTVAGNIFIHKATSDSQAIIINDPNLTAGYEKIQFCRSEADSAGIHWFHDKFGGYSFLENCVNIVANNGCVTLGAWNAPAVMVTATDNVGIGTTSPNYKLDVVGVIHSSVGMFSDGYVSALGQNTSSDKRLKDIKGDIDLSVGLYADAPMVSFEWTKNKSLGAQVGTIAQYWQRALPQVVHDRGDGYLSMQYDVAALLGTITIAKRVQNHEERIKELERENEALREQLKELKG